MNIALWALQGLLALHTVIGAAWKLSHSEASVPSLSALPHPVWMSLGAIEVLAAVALLLPVLGSRFAKAPLVGAAFLTCEMTLFTLVHLASGTSDHGEIVYWLGVAALSTLLAFGRRSLSPHTPVPATP